MIVDGNAIARAILKDTRRSTDGLGKVFVHAFTAEPSAATRSYLSVKQRRAQAAGMELVVEAVATEQELIARLSNASADAVLVQLPLPESFDTQRVLDAIPTALDADVLSSEARTRFEENAKGALVPPVVDAVREILVRTDVSVRGARAVVVGQGWLVGEPVSAWLQQQGAHVSIVTREAGDLSALKDADIVVSGAGTPGLITPDLLKEGVVLVDAGTSESGGAIVGDADPACAEMASVFTPVPGGVGPVAVACLFRNAAELAKRRRLQSP